MKNMIRKLAGVITVLGIVLGFIAATTVPGFADENANGSITINPPSATEDSVSNDYRIYKVFDAEGNGSHIIYHLLEGKSTDDGVWKSSGMDRFFDVDSNGDLTAKGVTVHDTQLSKDAIAAVKAYVESDAATWPSTGTNENVFTAQSNGKTAATVTNVPNGYYYITTSTGALVSITSANPNADVIDKRGAPEIDKVITEADSVDEDGKRALAQLGSEVTFQASVSIQKGTDNLVFHDTMSSGLRLNASSVQIDGLSEGSYEINTSPDNGETFTINFSLPSDAEAMTITITYKAVVTRDALITDPATNDAYLSYGNRPNVTPHSGTEVYNAQFTVVKQDNNGNGLEGAGFVISNRDGKYYKYTEGDVSSSPTVSWVDDINDATEYISGPDGNVTAFTGLANGTYTLIENTVPNGYTKAADTSFTIKEHDYSTDNLSQSVTVIDEKAPTIPRTGGRGTFLFYVIGGAIVAGAAVLLVIRRRKA